MSLPLEDIQVLDLTRLLPGPCGTWILADLGARVIKVETPFPGDYLRLVPPYVDEVNAGFAALHRGKRSVVARLDTQAGAEVHRRLAARCDVLVEGFRPGYLARFGLGWEDLSRENARLVYCSITGFGQEGPFAHRAAHDLNILALSGLGSCLVDREGRPVVPAVQLVDTAGGTSAAIAILAALHERERTGRGRHLDISMADAAHTYLTLRRAEQLTAGLLPSPDTDPLAGAAPGYRYYRCRDGGWISLGAIEPKFRERICAALGKPEWVDDLWSWGPETAELHAQMEALFETRTRDEWAELLGPLDACVEPVLDLAEAAAHPVVRDRMTMTCRAPSGPVQQPGRLLGAAFPSEREELVAPPPGLHTREVLRELGYTDAQIDELDEAGEVLCAPEAEGWKAALRS